MKKFNFFDRIFPASYDFYGMLEAQTETTAKGIAAMAAEACRGEICKKCYLFTAVEEADEIRMDMEQKLVDAFTTPFDRQDIYSISVEMDRIIETAKACVLAMLAYEIGPDEVVQKLATHLSEGMNLLEQAMLLLRKDHKRGEAMIVEMRQAQNAVEDAYRQGMAQLFKTAEPMMAMRKREVYRHLRDAAVFFGLTVDRYHKIVVRQV